MTEKIELPLRALSSSANGETLQFEIDRDGDGRGICRVRVERDGVTVGEIEFAAAHLSAFRGKTIRERLLMPAWRCGFVGDWVLAGSVAA
jgi:hypothetical protein